MSTYQNGEILIVVDPRGEYPGGCEEWNEVCYGKLMRRILITHGNAINSIQMAYERGNNLVYSHRRGGDGDKFDGITLEPWEQLTTVSGHYGAVDPDSGKTMVRSLTFASNRTTYGPFGREEGTPFCFRFQPAADLSFGGFHGRSGDGYLRAIGVYVATSSKCRFEPEPEPDRFETAQNLFPAAKAKQTRLTKAYSS